MSSWDLPPLVNLIGLHLAVLVPSAGLVLKGGSRWMIQEWGGGRGFPSSFLPRTEA